jgi:hypothetical protein
MTQHVQSLGRGHTALGGYGSCTNQAAEWKNRLLKEQRKDLAAALSPVRGKALPIHQSATTKFPLKAIPPNLPQGSRPQGRPLRGRSLQGRPTNAGSQALAPFKGTQCYSFPLQYRVQC